jgi:hypothetical protein
VKFILRGLCLIACSALEDAAKFLQEELAQSQLRAQRQRTAARRRLALARRRRLARRGLPAWVSDPRQVEEP